MTKFRTILAAAVLFSAATPSAFAGYAGGSGSVLSGLTNYSISRHEMTTSTVAPVVPSSLMLYTGHTGSGVTTIHAHSDMPSAQPMGRSAELGSINPVMSASGQGSLGGASFAGKTGVTRGGQQAAADHNLTAPVQTGEVSTSSSSSTPPLGSDLFESGLYEPNSWVNRFNQAAPNERITPSK